MKKKSYIIVGPTASGKTRLSLELAQKINGEIINADSMQVYEDVPILTARPTLEETKFIKHHLFGYLDSFSKSNVNHWLQQVKQILDSISCPVFVGGTGMYIKALTEGLSPIPDIPSEIRTQVRQLSLTELKQQLPNSPFQDTQRLMRDLEVLKTTGKSLTWWQQQPKNKPFPEMEFNIILLMPPKEKLYSQCNYRFQQMIEEGAIKQVSDLIDKNPQLTGGVFEAIGVKDLIAYFLHKQTLEQAIEHSQQLTRNYAKRQITWFKHQIKADLVLSSPILPKD